MTVYLVTYRPLTRDPEGASAAERFHHPPYADASCRRTPDFEAVYPSISAVCRGRNFAPRLRKDDVVVYLTTLGRYRAVEAHWRLVAVLRVVERFETHEQAAAWHVRAGLDLPSDCIVPENPPLPTEHTHKPGADLASWDAFYAARVRQHGAFLVCEPLWMDLFEPRVVTRHLLTQALGRVPGTRAPPALSGAEYAKLLEGAAVAPDGSHVVRPARSTNLGLRGITQATTPTSAPSRGGTCGPDCGSGPARLPKPRGGC